jgi:hypothetical protein
MLYDPVHFLFPLSGMIVHTMTGARRRGWRGAGCGVALSLACLAAGAQAAEWRCVARTEAAYLDIAITGEPGAWRIGDRARFPLREGYEFWYILNGTLVKTREPLRDLPYSWSGVLDIKKKHYKIGLDTEARWSHEFPDNPWFDRDASYTFGPRNDIGGQAIFFNARDIPAEGIAWLDQTPDWYQGKHVMSWPFDAPPLRLPAGKMMGFTARVQGATPEMRQERGETFTPYHLDPDKCLGPVIGCRVLGIEPGHMTKADFEAAADRWRLFGAQAFEMNEGEVWIPHASEPSVWFIGRLRDRYAAAGRKNEDYVLCPDYGGYGFNLSDGDPRWRYQVTPEELRRRDGYLQTYHGVANTINVKHYGTPQDEPRRIMNRIAQFESIKKAGYRAILFGWNMMEICGTLGYDRGYAWEVRLPNGGLILRSSLPITAYEEAVAHAFISCWYGDGLWIWDGQAVHGHDVTQISPAYYRDKETLLNGAQYRPNPTGYEPEPDVALDGYYVGAYLYSQCRATEGGARRYLPFTVGGKAYGVEPDGSDVVTAGNEQRGICQVRELDGHLTLMYYNPFAADLSPQPLAVTIDGETYRGTVYGRRIFVAHLR